MNEGWLLSFEKGCYYKNRYDSLYQVSKQIVYQSRKSKKFLRFYKCHNCYGYHITSKKANRKTLQQAKDIISKVRNNQ